MNSLSKINIFLIAAFLIILINIKKCVSINDDSINLFSQQQQQQQSTSQYSDLLDPTSKCEPLNTNVLQLCKDIAYNETRFPNFMKQKTQQEAAADTALYLPLIRINCSPVLKLFLCSLYAPPCVKNYSSTLKPCREMCEKAKSGCEDFMKRFSFNWPDYIDCWRFPSFNGPEACVTDENYSSNNQFQQSYSLNQPTNNNNNNPVNGNNKLDTSFFSNLTPQQLQILLNSLTSNSGSSSQGSSSLNNLIQNDYKYNKNNNPYQYYPTSNSMFRVKFVCPPVLQLISDTKNTYYLNVNEETINNCGMPCENNIFEKSEIAFARSWILIWSTICFCSTFFTILTYLIDTSRFRYPERPIIFLSACYMFVGLAYLIGSSSLTSNSVVCRPHKNAKMQTMEYIVQGVEHVPCTLLFMMIYFFGMASSIWWVVLTLTWFLAAGLKWGHEAIENISSYFHLAAWAIPGIKMIAILWLQKVDADILSGTCYTGIRNISILKGFVLAPLFLYLILGTCFLLAGFVSLFRIRNVMKHEGNKTDKLEKFMVRIGVFSILYMVPAIIVISCYFYEQNSYNKWIDFWLKQNSIDFNLPPDYVATNLYENDRTSMVFSLFMVKYAMFLVVGITSGFWIWSHKTISSWQRFFDKIFACFNNFQPKFKNEAAV